MIIINSDQSYKMLYNINLQLSSLNIVKILIVLTMES